MQPEIRATYRLQLRPGFGFEQAADVTGYLIDLGISHLFASPYLQAAAGSTHGYDVVDPTRVNAELGGAAAHERLCQRLQETGLGQMLDVVPNHMAIAGNQNPWWWDVLENGPFSRYATYFDIDWKAAGKLWPNKVLLPVLGDHYGRVLENGDLKLSHDKGSFVLSYHDHIYPVDPSSLKEVLLKAADACGSEMLAFIVESHGQLRQQDLSPLPIAGGPRRHKDIFSDLIVRLCSERPEVVEAIDAETKRLNLDPNALDAFILQQNYRLAFWRMAGRRMGYRRFFDIKELIGLRVEDEDVFLSIHALPIAWVRKGWLHGLRVDHPDGLRYPTAYFKRLRAACPDAWIVAEKILAPGEKLPSDWPVSGTTGYDFMNLVGGLFLDPGGEDKLTRIYEDYIGEKADFEASVRTSKRLVLTELFGSELDRLTHIFEDICERHRRYRDYTRSELREALCETAACFPVYRAYVSDAGNLVSPSDHAYVTQAIKCAMSERTGLDPVLFEFLKDLLLLRVAGSLESELAMRFQQLTSATMAKGLEDTAFYRYCRLVALNEVGGNPGRFGTTIAQLHRAFAEVQAERPLAMLASTTHDTKRSEDVRARLALLSEIPERWAEAVLNWTAHNERHRRGHVPDPNTEYLLYQTLVGAWPIDVERTTAYMEKAVREAKMHTSWIRQNQSYEKDLREFIAAIMTDNGFRAELEDFIAGLVTPGRINSLAQTLIKLTAPGVPDIYQGTELWDFSLVDPDNRRPVDFDLRRRLIHELKHLSVEDILARSDEGLPKLWLIRQVLGFRRRRPELFGPQGSYRSIWAQGSKADHVVALIRGEGAISVVPRLVMQLAGDWADTALELPAGIWLNILTDDESAEGLVTVREILQRFPVALLIRKQ